MSPGNLPAEAERTDLANARRLVEQYGDHLRHCPHLGGWFVWDSARWASDDTGEAMRCAKEVSRTIYDEAAERRDDSERQKLAKWAARTQSRRKLVDMLAVAESEPEIAVRASEFDADPMLFNVANGTLDLETEVFAEHSPQDMLTKLSPVAYSPTAEAPRWDSFLERVLPDPALRWYVCKAIGCSLLGTIREHVLFLPYGPGANGKSVFLETLQYVAGDYGRTADPGLLLQHRNDRHPTGVADLRGARFVSTTEPDPGKALAESLVKQLTGGDTVKARRMRQDFFEFEPTWTVWMAANHRPEVRGTDEGIWRRLKLIPFNVTIPREEQDPDLAEKLKEEASGILNWALLGLAGYWNEGLPEPDAVKDATGEYRHEMDPLGMFLEDRTQEGDSYSVPVGKLFDAWREWCEEGGEKAGTKTAFGRLMTERGFERFRTNSERRYRGIRLLRGDEVAAHPYAVGGDA